MNLTGKTVLLTGAAHGLGRELAHRLDREACSLYLVDCDVPGLDSLKAALEGHCEIRVCDLSQGDQRLALIETVENVDVLINCAGVGSHSRFSQMTVGEVARLIQVNTQAPLELAVGLSPGLTVNIGSVAGELRLPSIGLYSASKAALHVFTQSVALEGAQTLLVILGPLRGTDFVHSIAYPQTGQPDWYRRLDVPVETAGRLIIRAIKRGKGRIVLPRWYPVIFFLARFLSPAIKSFSLLGGRHVEV